MFHVEQIVTPGESPRLHNLRRPQAAFSPVSPRQVTTCRRMFGRRRRLRLHEDVWSPKATPFAEGYILPLAEEYILPLAEGYLSAECDPARTARICLRQQATRAKKKNPTDINTMSVGSRPRTPPRSLRRAQARLWTQTRSPPSLGPPIPATSLWSEIETWSTPQGWGQPSQ